MIYFLADAFDFPGLLNLFRYITFRSGAAVITALAIGLIIGPWMIGWLRSKQGKGQPIREDGPASHLITKRGTPTMGGLMILVSLTISTLLWMNFENKFVWACLFVTLGFRGDRLFGRLFEGLEGQPQGRARHVSGCCSNS